jgi:hypothetical protein
MNLKNWGLEKFYLIFQYGWTCYILKCWKEIMEKCLKKEVADELNYWKKDVKKLEKARWYIGEFIKTYDDV